MSTELQAKDVLPVIRGEFPNIRLPTAGDKVYNDECIYSFDTPFSDTGLFVSLRTFQGVGSRYLEEHSAKTGSKLYVHCKWTQVRKSVPEAAAEAAPTKLAIGVEGGFNVGGDLEVVKENRLAVIVDASRTCVEASRTCTFPLSDSAIPEFVVKICEGIVEHAGLRSSVNDSDTWSGDEPKMISKYADGLPFVDNGKRISNDPSTWKCEASGETNNLWLNLSTGYIGGGRRNWDGSGGSGAALQHYIDTGRQYPLCVKLGTITPHGADVWSYADDEDTLVLDPNLSEHLSRLGIDIMKLEKTEKTLSEMEVEMNLNYDWARIMEGGKDIQAVSGPGLIGLRNIGSSCYLNSVLQTLCAVPELADRYFLNEDRIRLSAPSDAENDFPLQMSKLVSALLSDRYVIPAGILTMPSDTIVSA
jgi:ubiquitin carboxyl-terminal hydrolase 5/13